MREYLLIFVVAAATTFLATPLVRWAAVATGALSAVRDRDVHVVPIPRLGGVAIFLGFCAATLVASRLPYVGGYRVDAPRVDGIFGDGRVTGIVIGAAILCLVGAIDDIWDLDWLTKLAAQVLAAGIMAYQGVQLVSLPLFGQTVLPLTIMMGMTIMIVLVSTNAVNFIDGLDGLAAGIVAIAALTFFTYAYDVSKTYNPPNVFSVATFVCAALAGCCLGFLPHNFFPARLFMGDSGALLLGLLLAAATISMTSIDPAQVTGDAGSTNLFLTWLPVLLPLAILSLPLLDIVLAVVRRTRAGRRPWQPDAHHLHHRMLRMGHTHRGAVLLMYLWAATMSFGVLMLATIDAWWPYAAFGSALVLAGVLTLRGRTGRSFRRRRL